MTEEPAVRDPAAEAGEVGSVPPAAASATVRPSRAFSEGGPLLALLRPFAAFAVVAFLVGRAIAPSAPGIAVGMGKLVHGLQIAGDLASQLIALASTIAALTGILVVLRARVAARLRVGAVLLGGFVLLATLSATGVVVPRAVGTLLAVAAGLLALLAASEAARAPFARVPAAALALMAVAGLARVASVYLVYRGADRGSAAVIGAARAVATGSFYVDAAAVALAAGWLGVRRGRLVSPVLLGALAVGLVLTRVALAGGGDDVGPASALLRGVADRLLTRPEPSVPAALRVFLALFAPVMALAGVGARTAAPALAGCLAIVLVVRSSPERPLCGLLLVVASLGLALAAVDGRALWASLEARRSQRPGEG
jgi:hypothetical protein